MWLVRARWMLFMALLLMTSHGVATNPPSKQLQPGSSRRRRNKWLPLACDDLSDSLFITNSVGNEQILKKALKTKPLRNCDALSITGKLVNAYRKSQAKIDSQTEIVKLLECLDIKSDVITYQELRFKNLVFVFDNDGDSSHSLALLLNVLLVQYPRLLDSSHVIIVPEYIRSISGLTVAGLLGFLKQYSLEKSKLRKPTDEDYQTMKTIFSANTAYQCEVEEDEDEKVDSVGKLAVKLMRDYWKHAIRQTLPSILDGLRLTERQIFITALTVGMDKGRILTVSSLASAAFSRTNYLSPQTACNYDCYIENIYSMTRKLYGNMTILNEISDDGNDYTSKEHPAPKYNKIQLNQLLKYIYPFANSLTRRSETIARFGTDWNGEANTFPIIPVVLLRSYKGFCLGAKAEVISYHPRDVATYLMELISGGTKRDKIEPFFPNFRGYIKKVRGRYRSYGVASLAQSPDPLKCTIEILVLPLYTSAERYKATLHDLLQKQIITSFAPGSNDVLFKIEMPKTNDLKEIYHTLKLVYLFNTESLSLLNDANEIQKFDSPHEVIEKYYAIGSIRYKSMMSEEQAQLELDLSFKKAQKFIVENMENRPMSEVITELRSMFPSLPNCMLDNVIPNIVSLESAKYKGELDATIMELEAQIQYLKDTTWQNMWNNDINRLIVKMKAKGFFERKKCRIPPGSVKIPTPAMD